MQRDEAFPPDARDARSLLAKVQKQKLDGHLIWAVMPSIDVVIRQIYEQNPKALITGYLDYANGLIKYLRERSILVKYMLMKSLLVNLKKKYKTRPVSKGANAYDMF